MISSFRKISLGSVVLAGALFSTAASAQSTRTWVSGVGDDLNLCTRTAPCKTFAGALANTAAGGEINCLDAGGFGSVTITQAVSIICDNVEAGVLAGSGTNGITVAAGPYDTVTLSGLDIHGTAGALNGIKLVSAQSLRVANTRVRGFNASTSYGLTLSGVASTIVDLENVTVTNNGSSTGGGGILVAPTSNTAMVVSAKHLAVNNNSFVGMRIDTVGKTSAGAYVVIDDGSFFADSTGLLVKAPLGTGVTSVTVTNSAFQMNATGVSINTPYAPFFGNNTITRNTTGLFLQNGSPATSFGDNHLGDNNTDGAFTTTLTTK